MDVWARKQDMNTKRAIHALAGMNDRLYAIGGNHLKGKRFQEVKRRQVNNGCFSKRTEVVRKRHRHCEAERFESTLRDQLPPPSSRRFMVQGSSWQMR